MKISTFCTNNKNLCQSCQGTMIVGTNDVFAFDSPCCRRIINHFGVSNLFTGYNLLCIKFFWTSEIMTHDQECFSHLDKLINQLLTLPIYIYIFFKGLSHIWRLFFSPLVCLFCIDTKIQRLLTFYYHS